MKRKIYISVILVFLILVVGYFTLGYVSSYVGWYGYKKWKNRVATQSIAESKQRNVFVKELNYKVDSFPGVLGNFSPYIEKGFKYGYHSSTETRELKSTQFLYQLSFNYRPTPNITVSIRSEDLKKFDSANSSWGYLKSPTLNDTIILEIRGEGIQSGIIKVW